MKKTPENVPPSLQLEDIPPSEVAKELPEISKGLPLAAIIPADDGGEYVLETTFPDGVRRDRMVYRGYLK